MPQVMEDSLKLKLLTLEKTFLAKLLEMLLRKALQLKILASIGYA